jgi:hypothetical protein
MTDELTPETTTAEAAVTEAPETDWKAEADKWKSFSRKHEEAAKSNAAAAKRLAEMEEAQKTAEQKAVDRAAELERRATAAELRALRLEVATAKGVPAESLEFLTGDTQEELEAKADKLLALMKGREETSAPVRPKESLKSGSTSAGFGDVIQVTEDELKGMKSAEIVKAREEGRLNKLLGIT